MRVMGTTLAVCVLFGSATAATDAEAARTRPGTGHAAKPAHLQKSGHRSPHAARIAHGGEHAGIARRGHVYAGGGISCVPYARSVTGMAITGDGGDWWSNAAGSYDRGQRPEPGSVMAFRATGGMS